MKILRSYYSIVILLVSLLYIGCKAISERNLLIEDEEENPLTEEID